MYEQIKNLEPAERVERMAKYLVEIPSVNSSGGEKKLAQAIEAILRSFPYFQKNPQLVWTNKLKEDQLERKNVFAFLPKTGEKNTVIYHAHLDTVGVEDYGKQKEFAFAPEKLAEFFKTYDEDEEVKKDALSEEWAFGRGMLDMKSGIAVHLGNLLYFSEHPQEQTGNLLFMINCVEENDHSGVIAAIPELIKLKKKHDLNYLAAINTDFVSPLYEGDQCRYIYTGAAGKLLTCFYIKGREVHVGNTLAGVDPTLLSSAINLKINNNPAICEDIFDEEILPSSCLMQRDQKDFYNVQTAKTAYMYFNTFLYEKSAEWIMSQLKEASSAACQEISRSLDERFEKYRRKIGIPVNKVQHAVDVYTYAEYIDYLENKGFDTKAIIQDVLAKYPELDKRSAGFEMIKALELVSGEDHPKVVIFFAPPFCPHNSIESGSIVDESLTESIETFSLSSSEIFKKRKFFPYLSDSSYLSMKETAPEIHSLITNFPAMEKLYPLPVEEIKQLAIPAVDIGVYGKGAHTWKERIYKPYSYEKLPQFIRVVTANLFQKAQS